MKNPSTSRYSMDLNFEAFKLSPVTDILIIAKKHPQEKNRIFKAFNGLSPDEFEFIEFSDDRYAIFEAFLINKKLNKRLSLNKNLSILEKKGISICFQR